jgi:hypothetical protein
MKMHILLVFLSLSLFASVEEGLVPLDTDLFHSSIDQVDRIYVINLDQRPEKWERSIVQLAHWGIYPQRVPGIYGWDLSKETLEKVGLRFKAGMWSGREWVHNFIYDQEPSMIFLSTDSYEKVYFSRWIFKGAIGCTLSHLSVLKHALENDYETIWILEDDFSIVKNPHLLSEKIQKLDHLNPSWDLLFTDELCLLGVDETRDLLDQLPMMWRPDFLDPDLQPRLKRTPVGDEFVEIGSRIRFHSVIYRRSAIKKILKFYKSHPIFTPFDHEVFFIEDLRCFILNEPIVTVHETTSDTRDCQFVN